MYFAFNRNVSPIVVQAFNQSLAALKTERDAAGVAPYERLLYRHVGVECSAGTANLTGAMAVVNLTADRVAADAPGTFQGINAGRTPYRDPADPEVYAFVYDTNLTMVAHGSNYRLVGQNFRGRTDVAGKAFRDEILATATDEGFGLGRLRLREHRREQSLAEDDLLSSRPGQRRARLHRLRGNVQGLRPPEEAPRSREPEQIRRPFPEACARGLDPAGHLRRGTPAPGRRPHRGRPARERAVQR